jgi:hypothetical protein
LSSEAIDWKERTENSFGSQILTRLVPARVLRVINKTKKTEANYHLHGHTLELVTSAKYLGLTITNKLQWDQHINNITAKANKTLGFLRRNLKIPSIRIKEQAYQTLVRP